MAKDVATLRCANGGVAEDFAILCRVGGAMAKVVCRANEGVANASARVMCFKREPLLSRKIPTLCLPISESPYVEWVARAFSDGSSLYLFSIRRACRRDGYSRPRPSV